MRHPNAILSSNKFDTLSVPGSVFFYAPNKGAPVFFAVAFAISGAFHIYQCMYVIFHSNSSLDNRA